MQVKMKTTSCGPDGNAGIGDVITVSVERGAALIDGGYASLVAAVDQCAPAVAETASQRAPEAAVQRRTRKQQ